VKSFSFSKQVDYKLDIKDTPVKGIKAYRLQSDDTIFGKSKSEGFVEEEDIQNLKQGQSLIKSTNWILANKKFLDHLQKWGYAGEDDEYTIWSEIKYDKFFSQLGNKNKTMVFEYDDAHMIFDINMEPLPVAVFCEYIQSNIDNCSYDLQKALKILGARKDVYLVSSNKVEPIPYYNAEPGRSEYIPFWWRPSVKDYRKMWKLCKKLSKEFPSCEMHQAIFELDLLGLRKGGAAKFKSFNGRYEKG
jgi:hypothetical protein